MILGRRFSRQATTALVAGVLFVALVGLGVYLPVPFVIWSPGPSMNVAGTLDGKRVIDIGGAKTFDEESVLRIVAVKVTKEDERVSFFRAFFAHLSQGEDVLPREAVYPRGKPADEPIAEESANVDLVTLRASAAGLRAASVPVNDVPMVTQVVTNGPSDGLMFPGDIIVSVDKVTTKNESAVRKEIRKHKVGDTIGFTVLRKGEEVGVPIQAGAPVRGVRPLVGLTIEVGYQFDPVITYRLPEDVRGAGGGLVLALAVYDHLTPGSLTGALKVAGAGTVSGTGKVASVGGMQERLTSAVAAGSEVFLLPESSCGDVKIVPEGLRLVPVKSVSDAVKKIALLKDPAKEAEVKGCTSGG